MKINRFHIKHTSEVAQLIGRTFALFNSKEGAPEAVANYIRQFNPDRYYQFIQDDFKQSKIFYIAIEEKNIVGMIRGDEKRIINLFVDGKYHRKGIGFTLLKKFEQDYPLNNRKAINIRSSLYAVPFYQKYGYKKTTGIRNFMGLNIQPMKKIL